MSLTQSPSDSLRQERRELLLDLAKQAESRKLQVRKMLADCAGERDKETERQRGARREALQKISMDVRELRESSVRPVAAVDGVPPTMANPAPPLIAALRPSSPPLSLQAQPKGVPASELVQAAQPKPAIPPDSSSKNADRDHGSNSAPTKLTLESAFESRMSGLEEAFTKLVETVTEKLDYSSRILQVETQTKGLESLYKSLKGSIDEVSVRLQPVENKCEVLRADHRSLELGNDRLSEQVKGFDQIFASLGRDAQKMNLTVDAMSVELRRANDRTLALEKANLASEAERAGEITALQDRLTRLESGLVRAIGLLQDSEHGIADLASLRERLVDMESGFQRVIKAVDSLQRPAEEPDSAAEREATANVLASLTKLVQGMRVVQNERQIQNGVKIA